MPTPLSYVLHNGTGAQTSFSFAAIDNYLSTGYIKVYLNGVLQTTGYTIDAVNENVIFSPTAPAAGVQVKLARETPTTSAGFTGQIVDFANGSVLTADDLDRGFAGMLHIVQEANDTGSGALGKTVDQLGWNAAALPVKNAGQAIDPADLVTKAQMDAVALFGASTIPQSWTFTGTGSQTAFTLSPLPSSTAADMFLVEVGGVIQRPSTDYSVTSTTLVFTTAPANAIGIVVRNFGVARNALDVVPNSSITNNYMAANSIGTTNIIDDAVTAAKLADNSVFTAAVQDDAITLAKMADDSVSSDQLTINAVATENIAAGAVTGPKIGSNAVTSDKIFTGAVDGAALGSLVVALTHMKATAFAGSGQDRVLHVDTAGALTAKNLSNVGFGGAITANLDFTNAFKCLNLGAPTSNGDALRRTEADFPSDVGTGYKLLGARSFRNWFVFGSLIGSTLTSTEYTVGSLVMAGAGNAFIKPGSGQGTWTFLCVAQDLGANANDHIRFKLYPNITNTTADASTPNISLNGLVNNPDELYFIAVRIS